MAGSRPAFRHLSRKSSHRKALLRNLVTSLFLHESIKTTWAKAKEAQRLAEKLVTLGKRNTNAARSRAQSVFFTPQKLLPKLFGTIRHRYANRPGGYTRVLRIEPLNRGEIPDQAESAILELVDGPRDMRFAMTAKTALAQQDTDSGLTDLTLKNIRKVTRFRKNGQNELEGLMKRMKEKGLNERFDKKSQFDQA